MGYANWIMIKHDTPDKPELWEAAKILELDPDAVLGKMIRVWIWFDTQTTDGYALSVTKALLDREVGVTGFCSALLSVGWMSEKDGKLFLPNFDRHNGETTKKRAQSRERMTRMRAKKSAKSYAPSVTKASPEEEEKEKKDSSTKSPKKKAPPKKKADRNIIPPPLDMVTAYCAERNNGIEPQAFIDHYEANGWQRGKTRMKDWQATIRTWEQQRKNNGSGQQASLSGGDRPKTARQHNADVHDYLAAELQKELDGSGT
jgi:hypothetical protein